MVVGFIFDLTILPDAHISPHFARRSLTEAPSIQDVGPFSWRGTTLGKSLVYKHWYPVHSLSID
jgi:hypothetical protein